MSDVVEVPVVEAAAGVPAGPVGLDAGDTQLLAAFGRAGRGRWAVTGRGGWPGA